MQSNLAINVCDVTKIYRLYDKPIDRLKESISLTHKKYHKEFFALDKRDLQWALSEQMVRESPLY